MPQTLQYRPLLIEALISNERISSYQNVFLPGNDVELMGVYLWNGFVCGALYPLMAAVEITLRNAIDQALVADMGRFWWAGGKLRYRTFAPGAEAPHPVQAVRENFAKATRSHAAEQRRRHAVRGNVMPQHHGIIAKTEFSTWEFLLDAEFMGRGMIWPKHLSAVFRGPWPVHRGAAVLAHAHDLVATLRDFRNRLFHHEPAWKRYGVLSEPDAPTAPSRKNRQGGKPAGVDPPGKPAAVASQWPAAGRASRLLVSGDSALSAPCPNPSGQFDG